MNLLQNESNSILGLEIGTENTRAVLFGVVEGSYHFIASGETSSTQREPFFDVGEGIFESISRLQQITGGFLLNNEGNLIMPSQIGGEGVDRLFVTLSGGQRIRLVAFGLLNEISLDSVTRLSKTTFGDLKETFSINDRRPIQAQMDAFLAGKPEIVLFSGGTNRGASRSIIRIAQMIGTVLNTIPADMRPLILYCGNQTVMKQVKEILERVTKVEISKNIRPALELEDLDNSSEVLANMVTQVWMKQIGGLNRIAPICSDKPLPSSYTYQRMIRFLGKQYDPAKSVLGIDLGSAHTTVSCANSTHCTLNVLPYGVGYALNESLDRLNLEEITAWIPESVNAEDVKTYLWQKTLFPASIPSDQLSLSIELATAKAILRLTMKDLRNQGMFLSRTFEPILIGGSILTRTATPQQALLTLLDGIQPTGITPLILDKHGILSILGAISKSTPILPVQVMETTAFTNLATVINAESRVKDGTPILKARLTYASGNYMDVEVKQGAISTLPLPSGETGLLNIKLLKRTTIEDWVYSEEPFRVRGGICGVVIDARGRPLTLPQNESERREKYKRWMFMLGG
jgi:hypothetical protein